MIIWPKKRNKKESKIIPIVIVSLNEKKTVAEPCQHAKRDR